MTTTDARPSRLDADDLVDPVPISSLESEHVRRERSVLARRLPYALVAVALAVGFVVGNAVDSSSSGSGTATKSIVSAEQINRALSTTNGAPVTNDRGYSKLENGVQHGHGFDLPMSIADRQELARELNLARDTALQYPTLSDAERAGLHRAGPFSPGLGTHMVSYTNYSQGAGTGPMSDDQIRHPLAWIYDGTKPDSPIAGLFYSATVADPAGFIGPNDVWHQHTNICITQAAGGGVDAPLGADHDATQAQCDAVGGRLIKATGPLVHAWVVPGYEDSQGVFAHLNPAVTCSDGTYHTVDITKIGTRLTACTDGTE